MTLYRFDQIAENITVRVEPSDTDLERYVGLEHLDPESLQLRRWGSPADVIGQKLKFWKGDIIYGKRRAYQRKLAVADFDGICSAHAMVLRAKPEVCLPEFLPFFLQSDLFHNRAMEISVGSLSPTINWSTLAKQEFPLPPVDEQRRIADLLWAADDVSQKYKELLESLNVVIRSHTNSIWGTQSNFESAWKNVKAHPTQWEVIPLQKSCLKIQDGTHFSPKSNGGKYRYVTSKNIKDGYMDFTDCGWISAEEHEPIYRRCDVKVGDILLTKDGANTGNVAINFLDEEYSLLSSVALIRTNPSLLIGKFLFYYLHSEFGRANVMSQMKGTAITRITLQQLKKLTLATPKLADQEIIIGVFDKLYETKEQILKTLEDLQKQNKLLLNHHIG